MKKHHPWNLFEASGFFTEINEFYDQKMAGAKMLRIVREF
jgi:hypothetical protein